MYTMYWFVVLLVVVAHRTIESHLRVIRQTCRSEMYIAACFATRVKLTQCRNTINMVSCALVTRQRRKRPNLIDITAEVRVLCCDLHRIQPLE